MKKLWRWVGRILKWSGIVVLALALLVGCLVGLAFAINAHDEAPTPETKALLVTPPNPFAPEDNIYYAFAGFDAPPGEPMIAVGQARIEAHNKHPASPEAPDPHRLIFKGSTDFCQLMSGSLWQEVPLHRAEVAKLLSDNWELYQRYLALHHLHGYYETASPNYTVSQPVSVRRLYLADVVLHLQSGDAHAQHAALADLNEDVLLWRSVLTGQGGLLSKMLAVANLHSDSLVAGDMIADAGSEVPLDEAYADLIAPIFKPRDWDIGNAFAQEFRTQASLIRQIYAESAGGWGAAEHPDGSAQPRWSRIENEIVARFFKLQATENLFALTTTRLITAAAMDPANFHKRISVRQALWREGFLYNPIGKALARVALPDVGNYSPRAWDGAALQRLVRAGYEIRSAHIDPAQIPAFLAQHPEWSTHPADGRPFLWDPATHELRVQTVAVQSSSPRRFGIPIWQGANAH
ncbi:MAG TPA: hypothetical protein VEH54_07590 [Steroidobacteraceae bacterium]|nr:hypothetical protein [Steroidobacteraceae bacterium]